MKRNDRVSVTLPRVPACQQQPATIRHVMQDDGEVRVCFDTPCWDPNKGMIRLATVPIDACTPLDETPAAAAHSRHTESSS